MPVSHEDSPMDERSSRIFFGLCMLVLVWIGVYWMWQPSQPVITFDDAPVITRIDDPEPEPEIATAHSENNDQTPSTGLLPPAQDPVVQITETSRLIPPEFFDHIVAQDEVMQTIARHYFGSIDDWKIIAKANPRVDPRKLKPGMILRIPKDKMNIQGVLTGKVVQPGVLETPRLDGSQADSKIIEYVVQSGDSLSRISQRIYGTSRHARFIFDSNRDILRTMDDISIGQLLKLPPIPSQQDQSSTDE